MLRIGEAREARGWTQAQLAQALGTTQQTVQRWESGQTDPKASQVKAVSEALGITVSFLLGVDEGSAPQLGDDERELLWMFNGMDAAGKRALMENAAFLLERHPKNKTVAMGA